MACFFFCYMHQQSRLLRRPACCHLQSGKRGRLPANSIAHIRLDCSRKHTQSHTNTRMHTCIHNRSTMGAPAISNTTGPRWELLRSPTDAHLFQQQLLLQLPPRAGWLPFLDLLLNLLYPTPRHVLHAALPFTNVLQEAREHETAQALRLISHAF